MTKNAIACTAAVLFAAGTATAADRQDDSMRIQKATTVLQEIMNTPDHSIPRDVLNQAKCVAIIPGDLKFALILGGNHGRGIATCRTEAGGWSAPIFIAVDGGSIGYQVGGSSTDLVLVFMNDHAMGSLLGDKFKLGADASVAAGPVGRTGEAATDARMKAEILSYSRTHGVFAGVSLEGTVVESDHDSNNALYGGNVDRHAILSGQVPVPQPARPLVRDLRNYIG